MAKVSTVSGAVLYRVTLDMITLDYASATPEIEKLLGCSIRQASNQGLELDYFQLRILLCKIADAFNRAYVREYDSFGGDYNPPHYNYYAVMGESPNQPNERGHCEIKANWPTVLEDTTIAFFEFKLAK